MIADYDEHCHGECASTYDEESGDVIDDGQDCAHCECCCGCLGCEYGPRDGMQLTAEQRAPIAAFEATDGELAREGREVDEEQGEPDFDDVPSNAGSAS